MTEDTSRSIPTADDINEALSKTGFLLEYRVAQILRQQHDCTVNISQAYPDPETGKSREIDVYASIDREIKRDPIDLTVIADLIVECKNSSAPFVLIGDHGRDFAWRNDSVILSFDPLRMEFPKAVDKLVLLELDLELLPGSATQDEFTGYQLVRLGRQNNVWKADNAGIYDSILYPLAKAWSYQLDQRNQQLEEDKEEEGMESWEFPGLYYVLPIVVTSGQVFAVDVTSGEPEVSEVKWARIKRSFNSDDLKCDLRADLVSFGYWEEYLNSRVIKMIDNAENVLARNLHLYDPEWLLANFGSPKAKEEFDEWLDYFRQQRDSPR